MKKIPPSNKSYFKKVLYLVVVFGAMLACANSHVLAAPRKQNSEIRIAVIVIEVSDRTILTNLFEFNEYSLNSCPKASNEIRLSDDLNISFGSNLLHSATATGVTLNTLLDQRACVNLVNNQTAYNINLRIVKKFGDLYLLHLNLKAKNVTEYGFSVDEPPISINELRFSVDGTPVSTNQLRLLTSIVDDYGPINPVVIVAIQKIENLNGQRHSPETHKTQDDLTPEPAPTENNW